MRRDAANQQRQLRQAQLEENILIEAADERLIQRKNSGDNNALQRNSVYGDDDGSDHAGDETPLLNTPDFHGRKIPHGVFVNDHAGNQYDLHFFKHRAWRLGDNLHRHSSRFRQSTRLTVGDGGSPLTRALVSPDYFLRDSNNSIIEDFPLKIRSNPESEESLHLPRPFTDNQSASSPLHFDDIVEQSAKPAVAKNELRLTATPPIEDVSPALGRELSTIRHRSRSPSIARSARRNQFWPAAECWPSIVGIFPSRTELLATFLPVVDSWRSQSWRARLAALCSMPCIWLLAVTVVTIDLDESAQPAGGKEENVRISADNDDGDIEDIDSMDAEPIQVNRWPKWLVLLNSLLGPQFVVVGLGLWMEPIIFDSPVFTFGFAASLLSLLLFLLTSLFSDSLEPPRWYKVSLVCVILLFRIYK